MALSRDLRLRIVDLVASGVSRREAARRVKVTPARLSGLSGKLGKSAMLR